VKRPRGRHYLRITAVLLNRRAATSRCHSTQARVTPSPGGTPGPPAHRRRPPAAPQAPSRRQLGPERLSLPTPGCSVEAERLNRRPAPLSARRPFDQTWQHTPTAAQRSLASRKMTFGKSDRRTSNKDAAACPNRSFPSPSAPGESPAATSTVPRFSPQHGRRGSVPRGQDSAGLCPGKQMFVG